MEIGKKGGEKNGRNKMWFLQQKSNHWGSANQTVFHGRWNTTRWQTNARHSWEFGCNLPEMQEERGRMSIDISDWLVSIGLVLVRQDAHIENRAGRVLLHFWFFPDWKKTGGEKKWNANWKNAIIVRIGANSATLSNVSISFATNV